MGGHAMHEPGREAHEVAGLGEEVVVVVKRRHWLKVMLAKVLLVVVRRGCAPRVHKHDGRLPGRCSRVEDATRQRRLVDVVAVATAIAQIDGRPHHDVRLLPLLYWQGVTRLRRMLHEGLFQEVAQLLELLGVVQLPPELLGFGRLVLALPSCLCGEEGVVDVVRFALPLPLALSDEGCVPLHCHVGQLVDEICPEVTGNIHRGD
mmetsp:Transcript_93937/g.292251  ORF Transcript_93937/g.292251 Transcript_93937/m.292251 type:complete len:205 (-) Transcript_93937:653-1267(-)